MSRLLTLNAAKLPAETKATLEDWLLREPMIAALQETRDTQSLDGLLNWTLHQHQPTPGAGGVITAIPPGLTSKRLQELERPGVDAVWVLAQTDAKKMLLGNIYRRQVGPQGPGRHAEELAAWSALC